MLYKSFFCIRITSRIRKIEQTLVDRTKGSSTKSTNTYFAATEFAGNQSKIAHFGTEILLGVKRKSNYRHRYELERCEIGFPRFDFANSVIPPCPYKFQCGINSPNFRISQNSANRKFGQFRKRGKIHAVPNKEWVLTISKTIIP